MTGGTTLALLLISCSYVLAQQGQTCIGQDDYNWLQSEVKQFKKERTVVCATPCHSGWQKFGCSCYYRSFTEVKTWEESRQECQKSGADLVVINSQEEQEFIRGLRVEGETRDIGGGKWEYWIGLRRIEGTWTWVDGTPLTAQNWDSAHGWPDYYPDWNCAGDWQYQEKWRTHSCSANYVLICEKLTGVK